MDAPMRDPQACRSYRSRADRAAGHGDPEKWRLLNVERCPAHGRRKGEVTQKARISTRRKNEMAVRFPFVESSPAR